MTERNAASPSRRDFIRDVTATPWAPQPWLASMGWSAYTPPA